MVTEKVEEPSTVEEPQADQYDLHINLNREMQPALKKSAELAYAMGDIPKPNLVNLMELFIGWGLTIQKQKWIARMGYK